jgi:hypothetical protein
MADVDPEAVRRHLDKLLISDQLGKSEASRKLLTYLVERSLRNDTPKETEIALDVFGKGTSFNGAEDSVVRVGVRTLRQKLTEYYAGPGRHDELHLVIPKGGYRLTVATPTEAPAPPGEATQSLVAPPEGPATPRWSSTARIAATLLAISLFANLYLLARDPAVADDPIKVRVRHSAIWADVVSSRRPLTIVLGDLFMFTQVDAKTGRTLTVRDAEINSSEELRAFLASNPAFASERGQRYVSMIQKSAAVGMAAILRIVDEPGRHVEVTVRDELQTDQIRNNDIIYVGPLSGLGPLSGYYQLRSRYRYNAAGSSLTDIETQKVFLPEGVLSGQRMDYALATKFTGPDGNHIMIFTSGVRNAGVLQIVRTLTSPAGLDRVEAKLRAKSGTVPDSFEALLTVTGFRQTDLAADIIEVNALPAVRVQQHNTVTSQRPIANSVIRSPQ